MAGGLRRRRVVNSLGWYEGFRLLAAVDPTGVVTGFGFSSASSRSAGGRDLVRVRARPNPRIGSAGRGFGALWSTRASRGQITTGGGLITMERGSFAAQT